MLLYRIGDPSVPDIHLKKSEMLRDTTGNYWCKQCFRQCELMNWVKAHEWPEVNCPPYAIAGGDHELWQAAIYLGHSDFIAALYTFIFAEDTQSA